MISELCGQELISKQQKNISFGANSFRDGQSYTEQEKRKNLVEYSDLSKLAVGECYVLMPEPAVRLAKIQVPKSDNSKLTEGFMVKQAKQIAAKPQDLSDKPEDHQQPHQQQQNTEQQDAQDNSESNVTEENRENKVIVNPEKGQILSMF